MTSHVHRGPRVRSKFRPGVASVILIAAFATIPFCMPLVAARPASNSDAKAEKFNPRDFSGVWWVADPGPEKLMARGSRGDASKCQTCHIPDHTEPEPALTPWAKEHLLPPRHHVVSHRARTRKISQPRNGSESTRRLRPDRRPRAILVHAVSSLRIRHHTRPHPPILRNPPRVARHLAQPRPSRAAGQNLHGRLRRKMGRQHASSRHDWLQRQRHDRAGRCRPPHERRLPSSRTLAAPRPRQNRIRSHLLRSQSLGRTNHGAA